MCVVFPLRPISGKAGGRHNLKGCSDMKRTISILLIILASLSLLALAGCGNQEDTVSISSALDYYNQVWSVFNTSGDFPGCGGDSAHSADNAPGQFDLNEENAPQFQYLLHVNEELYDMLDQDAATLLHMMNLNTFTSAVARLKEPDRAGEFAQGYQAIIREQHWLCGAPEQMVVIGVGDYVVMAFGHTDNITNLISACTTVTPGATVLVSEAIVA